MQIMIKWGLEGEKESHTISVGVFTHREDLKMYGQLPDFDDIQRYDMGIDTDLSRMAGEMYADFHKPLRQALKRHFPMAEIPKKLLRDPKIMEGNGKRASSNKKECLRGAPKSQ